MSVPQIGVGIIIQNKLGQILVGKRKGSHAPYFSIPGGSLEIGESFEEAAHREAMEETGLELKETHILGVTNNLKTYKETGIHYISVVIFCNKFSGVPEVKEKEKCEAWHWVSPQDLPQPHFEASSLSVACMLQKKCYVQNGVSSKMENR
jgi:ADP-ribose pyrophosphatase YjhB (NUDIX family)